MTGYDLATGDEKWFVRGMPAACCTSPVSADGNLFFAAWSPGDPSEPSDFKMPTFDELLKQVGDDNGDGDVSFEESKDTDWGAFFESNDANKDGVISRREWDGLLEYIASSRNTRVRVAAGRNRRCDGHACNLEANQGPSVRAVGNCVRGPTCNGQGRRHRHGL